MSPETTEPSTDGTAEISRMDPKLVPLAIFAWLWVAIPLSYGLWKLLGKIDALF